MVKLISWNIAQREAAWRFLIQCDADIALLQEAAAPPADVADMIEVDPLADSRSWADPAMAGCDRQTLESR